MSNVKDNLSGIKEKVWTFKILADRENNKHMIKRLIMVNYLLKLITCGQYRI